MWQPKKSISILAQFARIVDLEHICSKFLEWAAMSSDLTRKPPQIALAYLKGESV